MSESQLPSNIKAFLDNSMRLLDDAEILRKHERYSSAFVLAVISLEEVGKAILEFWRKDGKEVSTKGRSGHVQKQAAVACMVLAGEFVPALKAIALAEDDDEDALNKAAERGYAKDAMSRMINVEKKLLDKAKQAGLYQDDDGSEDLQMQQFTAEQVNDVVRQALLALRGVSDALTRNLAHQFFEANRGVFSS